MNRRLVWLVTLEIALTGILIAVQNVDASRSIYIRRDGRVDPPTAPISNVDNIMYTFTDNIYDSIMIERDNIVVDGADYTVQGTSAIDSKGMFLAGRTNVTLKNMKIKGFAYGIYLVDSSMNTFSGISLTNNEYGLYLESSSSNVLKNNSMIDNSYNFGVYGVIPSHFLNYVDASNTVDGKPVYYWVNRQKLAVPLDAGYVALVNCSNILVQDLNLTRNGEGILLVNTEDSNITGNNVANNEQGVWLHESSNNVVSENNVVANRRGIWLTQHSKNNLIARNNIRANNEFGIYLLGSSNNIIYHNSFMINEEQAYLYESFDNTWNDEPPSNGNYWSDHNPPDENKDQIGDVLYIINEDNLDMYPLIYPYGFVPKPDVNRDGTVNIIDIATVAAAFGCEPGDERWNPMTDMDINEIVNIIDIASVARDFG